MRNALEYLRACQQLCAELGQLDFPFLVFHSGRDRWAGRGRKAFHSGRDRQGGREEFYSLFDSRGHGRGGRCEGRSGRAWTSGGIEGSEHAPCFSLGKVALAPASLPIGSPTQPCSPSSLPSATPP